MRNKSLIILSTVVITLGVAAYFLEKSEDQVEASKYIRLPIQADQISRLIIERENETIYLQSTSDGWIFKQDSMKADSTYVKDLTERIQSAEFEPVILVPGQTMDQFRFEKPALKLTITDHLNRSNTLTMSDRRNFAGEPYFRINQENQIYTLNTDLDKKLLNKMIFFQEKHIFKNQYEEFIKIQVQSLNHKFDVLKVSGLDPALVTAFISKLKNMTVQQYLAALDYCNFKTQTMSVVLSAPTVTWSLRMALDTAEKKLYAEAQISDSENIKKFCIEYDTSYWAYFSNLSEQQFVKDRK
jgi:Domain of unknown function (DUF4340)